MVLVMSCTVSNNGFFFSFIYFKQFWYSYTPYHLYFSHFLYVQVPLYLLVGGTVSPRSAFSVLVTAEDHLTSWFRIWLKHCYCGNQQWCCRHKILTSRNNWSDCILIVWICNSSLSHLVLSTWRHNSIMYKNSYSQMLPDVKASSTIHVYTSSLRRVFWRAVMSHKNSSTECERFVLRPSWTYFSHDHLAPDYLPCLFSLPRLPLCIFYFHLCSLSLRQKNIQYSSK